MRALLRPSLVVLGTTATLVAGGGMLAFAGWTSRTDSKTFTVHAAGVPQIPRPIAALAKIAVAPDGPGADRSAPDGPAAGAEPGDDAGARTDAFVMTPRVQWRTVRLTADEAVHRYVVTRHDGKGTHVVCTLPATRTPSCLDTTAPPGATLTYTITATYGAHWVGRQSEPSPPVIMPAAETTDGVPVDPSRPPGIDPSIDPGATAGGSAPGIDRSTDKGGPLILPDDGPPAVDPSTAVTVTPPSTSVTKPTTGEGTPPGGNPSSTDEAFADRPSADRAASGGEPAGASQSQSERQSRDSDRRGGKSPRTGQRR